jgi:endonuclease/exonuclease/phosphatase family metal-dependent hydrolase
MRITLATYNIHKGIGGVDRKYRPERIVDTLAPFRPDFVLLQEVDEGVGRSAHHRQVDLLGEMLCLRHRTYFPNVRLRGGGHYGNAILSRYPFTETRNIDLSVPLTKRRSVLHARFRVRGPGGRSRTIHVYNLHLGLSALLRRLQIGRFLESQPFVGLDPRTPIIVAGDFNDVWGTLGKAHLIPKGFRGTSEKVRTFPAWAPVWPLDGVYVRGDLMLRHLRRPASQVARQASDHLPLIADLQLSGAKSQTV